MEPTSYSADSALAEALARLKYVEDENIALRSRVDQLTKDTNRPGAGRLAGSSAGSELDALKKQNDEVSYVLLLSRGISLVYSANPIMFLIGP